MVFELTAQQEDAVQRSLARYSDWIGQDTVKQATDAITDGLRGILNPQQVERDGKMVTVGVDPVKLRSDLQQLIARVSSKELADEIDLNFIIETARDVARGAGNYAANQNPTILDAFPADELFRIAPRVVPRGYKRMGKTIIPVPEEDWPHRFEAAAIESGDTDAAAVLQATGRMVALKNSDLWQALGDGAGGFDDMLGNPYPPFAFNSGMWTRDVPREEAQTLGLIDAGEKIQPVSLENLFKIP